MLDKRHHFHLYTQEQKIVQQSKPVFHTHHDRQYF